MVRAALGTLAFFFAAAAGARAEKRPVAVADLFAFQRVADPQISPDGKNVVYQVTAVDLAENKSSTNLWVAATDGATPPRRLTTATKSDRHPRWSPDGTKILFESSRSGELQLWVIEVAGGEARQLTTISTGASNAIWSADGKSMAFVSAVYPEFSEKPFAESDALNKKKLDAAAKGPVKAKVFTRLFFRHWDEYVEDKRQHLFVMPAAGGEPKDVTPGDRDAYPTSTTFSVGDEFTFAPDGRYLVFTAVPARDEAWGTNYDLCRVAIDHTSTKWQTLTENPAADGSPRFDALGKTLFFRAQKKAGYEADKWDVMSVPLAADGTFADKPKNLTEKFDLSVHEFVLSGTPLGSKIIFTADERGSTPVFELNEEGVLQKRCESGQNSSLSVGNLPLPRGASSPIFAFSSAKMDRPSEVMVQTLNGGAASVKGGVNISHANDDLLAQLERPRPESVDVPVAGGVKMQMWILKPPGFDPAKKWPVAYLVHGGPQGAWGDGWSYRWNPQAWAAQGYVVVLPNPRGSTGFGQKFVDEISGDWGGNCYDDLIAGVDYVEKLPYVDKSRIASAGGSFGGYMMNWFAVNTGRFKTLITHCSVWNFDSMWGTTDELWFDEFEHGGVPWEKPASYAKFSPHRKAAGLGKYKTPMLVIHNDLDFRCPIGQGHELFSALQRQGVPSRFVNFPDEGHWVLKPKNSEYWHAEVFAWLKKYCPPGGK